MSTLVKIIYSLFLLIILFNLTSTNEICKDKLTITGPGWDDPTIIFPSRYFFIETTTSECHSLIQHVSIESLDNNSRSCLIKKQIFNVTSYNTIIVRYKILNNECSNGISINLLDFNNNIITSKYYIKPIISEECNCDINDFINQMKCNENTLIYKQLDDDLKQFTSLNNTFKYWLDDAINRFGQYTRSYSLCHYQIKSNRLYRNCYGEYVGFSQFFDAIFNSLLRKTTLPDTEFIVNLGDWPLSSKSQPPIPIFSWCGSTDTFDIVLPTYEMTESVLEMQNRIQVDILSILGQDIKWNEKQNKLFWRGRDSNRLRLLLVYFSKENPQLIDAGITNFFFFRSDEELDKYGPKVSHVSFFDYFKYKYLANIDGTVAAFRLPFLIAGSSLVLKQSSKYYEHFYHLLKPGEHFIQLKEDLTDLHSVLSKLTNQSDPLYISQEKQIKMALNARNLVKQYLLPNNIYCYYYNAIIKYSKQLTNGVVTPLGEDVTQGNNNCLCSNKKTSDKLNINRDEL